MTTTMAVSIGADEHVKAMTVVFKGDGTFKECHVHCSGCGITTESRLVDNLSLAMTQRDTLLVPCPNLMLHRRAVPTHYASSSEVPIFRKGTETPTSASTFTEARVGRCRVIQKEAEDSVKMLEKAGALLLTRQEPEKLEETQRVKARAAMLWMKAKVAVETLTEESLDEAINEYNNFQKDMCAENKVLLEKRREEMRDKIESLQAQLTDPAAPWMHPVFTRQPGTCATPGCQCSLPRPGKPENSPFMTDQCRQQ